ncbi:hypothetical protein CPLU01_14001 [Colletotrichum plurivorum]|uniref:Uncharacterized protein n=1 Tax=Colletotrichum plurivorum TaxID=2175906 RepID=A0A8H6N0M1_9PEZI|nr:hypothetical protein CPLU01_14001 [Colletotrichum plurivorum]
MAPRNQEREPPCTAGLSAAVASWLIIGGVACSPWINSLGNGYEDVATGVALLFSVVQCFALSFHGGNMSEKKHGIPGAFFPAAMAGFTLTTLYLLLGPKRDSFPPFAFWASSGFYFGMAFELFTCFFAQIAENLATQRIGESSNNSHLSFY